MQLQHAPHSQILVFIWSHERHIDARRRIDNYRSQASLTLIPWSQQHGNGIRLHALGMVIDSSNVFTRMRTGQKLNGRLIEFIRHLQRKAFHCTDTGHHVLVNNEGGDLNDADRHVLRGGYLDTLRCLKLRTSHRNMIQAVLVPQHLFKE